MRTIKLIVVLLLVALALCAPARAQNTVCPTASPGTSNNQCASTAFVQNTISGGNLVINAKSAATPALTINTLPNSIGNALVLNQTLSGNAPLGYWNQLNILSDTVNCAFCVDFYIQHSFGGATGARGTRTGFAAWLIQTAPTTGSGTNSPTPILGIGQANVGDGGTGTGESTSKGSYFGANFIARWGDGSTATNIHDAHGLEIDVQSAANSTARYTFGNSIVNFEAVQGTQLDSAYVIYSGGQIPTAGGGGPWGPGVGFHNGITFAELSSNGLVPLDSTATVLGTHLESLSTIHAAVGIDLRGFTFDGGDNLAFVSNGFSVTQSGNILGSGQVNIGGTASGQVSLQPAAAAGGVWTFPNTTDTIVGKSTADTLSNKTIAAPIISGVATTAASSQISIGGSVAAASNCGSLSSSAGCLVINVAGTTRYVPYY